MAIELFQNRLFRTDTNLQNLVDSEKGSVTVLVAFTIPIFLLLIVLIANIGQLIFEKIRLQNTADICAISAAGVQSAGLNEIADLNWELENEYRNLKHIINRGIWVTKIEGWKVVKYYKDLIKTINRYQDQANTQFSTYSVDIAKHVMKINQPLNRSWKFDYQANNPLTKLSRGKRKSVRYIYLENECVECEPVEALGWSDGKAGSKAYKIRPRHDGTIRGLMGLPPVSQSNRFYVNVKRKKSGLTKFSLSLTQASKRFDFGGGLFGLMPELRAMAEAKPTGGHIYNGNPDYRPILIK